MLKPIKLNSNNQRIWFTSDCHFNHNKSFILDRYNCKTTEEYNQILIEKWNAFVSPDDIIFNLGDFVMNDPEGLVASYLLQNLNGNHYLLWGNHNSGVKLYEGLTEIYNTTFLGHYQEIIIDKQPIVLCHYPILAWNDYVHGTWMLHGHNHNTFKDENYGKILDVGLDSFKVVVHYQIIKQILDSREIKLFDEHEKSEGRNF